MSWLSRLFRSDPSATPAERLYAALVEQARQPAFFREGRVPDSLDGRFEMLTLHAFLVLRRLRAEGPAGAALAQRLFDRMFVDMDESLREIGVGDLSVGKRVKAMAKAFYGRSAAYEAALSDPAGSALADALARNLYGTLPDRQGLPLAAMGRYLGQAAADLAAQPAAALLEGRVSFPAPGLDRS
ncbi:MAG TPA: ubiquinol-cytochrome C chaperone family protein [Hypericibacter adhaerens]|uniref:Ubiquinol-cytochrome c chaperone n=1 Tax=Hypericibacter adhaerens TaxID=2602016 RepID=A0A5J6MYP7_9PROT|nr:ubiquinol-cytochrome C chaperone family protein [Hypericibacter adhaerens]QEX22709.1 ubiquinol-cytochrome c chaperone [Hypericibacter adhaerens]HWA42889.1 ubiquinol-cytochrome C chaperone family protein [Hypericibacter adhaerens]